MIETSFSTIALGIDGICRVVLKPNIVVGLPEMKENLAILTELLDGKSAPMLIDMRKIKTSTREAREFAAGPEYTRVMSALAMLSAAVVGTVLGNLFINFSKPRFPTRLFSNEEQAIDWLKKYLQESKTSKHYSIGVKNGKG